MTVTRVGTANIRDTLNHAKARRSLQKVLHEKPHLLSLPEWGPARRRILDDLCRHSDYRWLRPTGGGSPLLYDSTRFLVVRWSSRSLAPRAFVGRIVGRKSTLPRSPATVVLMIDRVTGRSTSMLGFHLTAEVQKGAGYRRDPWHVLRVARHVMERRRLAKIARGHKAKCRRVFAAGDTNYDGMTLPPLVSCWDGRKSVGTLGGRAVDVVYAPTRAHFVTVIPTDSDHHGVIATYKENP